VITKESLETLREWVRAEIYFALAKNETDEDGYYTSAKSEEKLADSAFEKLRGKLYGKN
jgi:hypothetical protein